MYWWWPRSCGRASIYTIKSVSLIHGLDSCSFLMELVFAACCFVFPVWALSLQSYEGDHEDDFDFLWKLWLDTANKILLSPQINGLLHGGVLVLKRGLFVLRAFSLRYHCGKSLLRRREVWQEFREEAEHNYEQLTPHSFSHRFAIASSCSASSGGWNLSSYGIHDWSASEELREV